jgi:hypothetical protein
MMRFRMILTTLAIAALTAPAAALAADPSNGEPPPGAGGGAGGQVTGGSLPFTGLNLGLILAGAAMLIATGLLLRRRASSGS